MKISLGEIKKLVPYDISTTELVDLIGSRLVEVEEAIDLAPKYQGVYIVKVVECQPLEGTHLSLCQIDAGRDALIQVVCGAPNVYAGMLAAWISPGSTVPSTYGRDDFVLSVRPLRGYDSHGMLASASELDLGEDHDGIVELEPDSATPGTSFAEHFGLDDIILDIENKSLTHRPDCFGLIGFAREVAGILGQKFQDPELLFVSPFDIDQKAPAIKVENPELCARYSCAVVKFDQPVAAQKYLTREHIFLFKAGMRPVSPLVNLTNIIMLQTGQPLHAFDYDKILQLAGTQPEIIVRTAREGEQITLLDEKTITCDANDILITANDIPVALAGAMGCQNTAVDQNTTTILLESATFSLYHLRKTQMKHGLFSEAITRFTKGQPAGQTFPVLAETLRQLNAKVLGISDYFPAPESRVVVVSAARINQILGTNYSLDLIKTTLENVSFMVETSGEQLTVRVPYWRTDIAIEEDVVEEIGRLLGFDNIPQTFAKRDFVAAENDPLLALKTRLRHILSDQLAAHEVLTYSFVNQDLLKKVGQNPADSYQIINSISPDLQVFRQHIVPSLLDKIRENIRAGHDRFALFEFNQTSVLSAGKSSENTPVMGHHLGLVILGDYYAAKVLLARLLRELGIDFVLQKFESADFPYLEPLHSADVLVGETRLGSIGEVKPGILRQFKLAAPIAVFELDLAKLLAAPQHLPVSTVSACKFPAVERDLTVSVPDQITFEAVEQAIKDTLQSLGLVSSVLPVSIYQATLEEPRRLSFHLKFTDPTKTQSAEQISAIIKQVTNKLQTLDAQVV